MTAMPEPSEPTPRGSRFARWAAQQDGTTPGAAWLFGEPNDQAGELARLREQLAEAERRAEEAEEALPHLLALGQRTVNGLLNDARARGRQIIEEARAKAELEAAEARKAVDREASELDALRMAVACEAMGLEAVRTELEARVKELEAGGIDATRLVGAPALPSSTSPVATEPEKAPDADAGPSEPEPAPAPARWLNEGPVLPPPPSPSDLASVGMGSKGAKPDPASSRFADAWARGEDEMMAEAFDRFFAAHIEDDSKGDLQRDSDQPRRP